MSFVVGIHAVTSMLRQNPGRVRQLLLLQGRRDQRLQEIVDLAKDAGVRIQVMDKRGLDQRSNSPHQGVVADCHDLKPMDEWEMETLWPSIVQPCLILVIDGVTDPRNLGACLRTANAVGVDMVLLPKRNSAPINEIVLKTAAGGAENLAIVQVTNLARRLEWLADQGVWITGTTDQASKLWNEGAYKEPTAIVMGSEGKGMRTLTAKLCDDLVRLPMGRESREGKQDRPTVESLNVSVACGVILYEVVRQRLAQL